MSSSPLCTALGECLDGWARQADPYAVSVIEGARQSLGESVPRLAIGGRLKAGKSTLVNALLGRELAGTGQAETTTLVTWFRYGDVAESEVGSAETARGR